VTSKKRGKRVEQRYFRKKRQKFEKKIRLVVRKRKRKGFFKKTAALLKT